VKPLHPGDSLDHYRIEELVARSGMASIFRATDLRTSKQVTIKVPHPEAAYDPVFFDRFRREAQIGREMDHPGVMRVLSAGDYKRVYMAKEWVEGKLLRQLLAEERKLEPSGQRESRWRSATRSITSTRVVSCIWI
jgi:serine/threonine protein kinase